MNQRRFNLDGAETPMVSVSIEWIEENRFHAGILYRDSNDVLYRLHLGWHKRLFHTPYSETVPCAIPNVDPAEVPYLAGYFGRIGQNSRNGQIPYNLRNDESITFDFSTGEILLHDESTGLSCATFVHIVFRSAGIPLIDTTNWPEASEEDIQTQVYFVAALRRSSVSEVQLQADRIQGEIGTPRIRPDHVAGACLVEDLPAIHPDCEMNGGWIRCVVMLAS